MAELGFPRKAITEGTFFASESFMRLYCSSDPTSDNRLEEAVQEGIYSLSNDTIKSVVRKGDLLEFNFGIYNSHIDLDPNLDCTARVILGLPTGGTLDDYRNVEVQVIARRGNVKGFRARP